MAVSLSGSGSRARGFKVTKRIVAFATLIFFCGLARLLGGFGLGYVVLPPFLAAIVAVAFQYPPVAGSFLLFGWVILPEMDMPAMGGLPRIPATSLIALILLSALAVGRTNNGSVRLLFRPIVGFYVGLFTLIFALGYLGILLHGKWGSVLIKTLAWQKLVSCGSMFACGILCCRDRADFRFILRLMPLWFLLYLFYIPLDTYLGFFRNILTGESAYAAGLSFGTLNTNTLGQGACLVAIVAAAILIPFRVPALDRILYGGLFCLASAFTLVSASRQSLLALVVGLGFVVARVRPMIGLLLAAVFIASAAAFMHRLERAAAEQVFLGRFADIGRSTDEWSTGSFSERRREIEMAIPHLGARPLIGYGFGGYSLAGDIPDVRSRSDFNETDFMVHLWNDGYFVVGEHNFPIALYLQTGAVGTLAFAVLSLGPWIWLRRSNRRLFDGERQAGYVDDIVVMGLWVAIFVLQNISGGLALGSMTMLFFIVGAMVGGLAGTFRRHRTSDSENTPEAKI